MQLRIMMKAVRTLLKEVGVKQFLSYLPHYLSQKRKGMPWSKLPAPEWKMEKKDAISKKMIGDAIIFYELLLKDYPPPQALAIIKEVVFRSAITQLKLTIPKIKKDKLLKMSYESQLRYFTNLAEKFYNADWEILSSPDEFENFTFAIRISRCRFVELVRQVGYPELSGIFCHGDLEFFEKYQPEVIFRRPKNIGFLENPTCDFIFTLKS